MNKELLLESVALVDLPDDGLTTRFYAILFERYPAVRPMFSRDIRPQAKMLRSAVVAVLEHLDDSRWLTKNLADLGTKHAEYGATPEMYDAVAICMIAAMEEIGGDSWTAEMSDAWREALGAVAGLMMAGYPQAAAS